jgi:hypothetical protein
VVSRTSGSTGVKPPDFLGIRWADNIVLFRLLILICRIKSANGAILNLLQ